MKYLPTLCTLLAAATLAHAGEKQLFNGKDLSGWKGVPDFWSVQDGAITGKTTTEHMVNENTFLIWQDGEVGDFELTVKYKIVDSNGESNGFGNSGIQYRSKIVKPEYSVVAGYQADFETTKKYSGILYEEKGRGILALRGQKVAVKPAEKDPANPKSKDFAIEVTGSLGDPDEIQAAIHPADWNEYKIIAKGGHLQHFINGKQTVDVTDSTTVGAKTGLLALQLHNGPTGMTVQFKDMVLKTE